MKIENFKDILLEHAMLGVALFQGLRIVKHAKENMIVIIVKSRDARKAKVGVIYRVTYSGKIIRMHGILNYRIQVYFPLFTIIMTALTLCTWCLN